MGYHQVVKEAGIPLRNGAKNYFFARLRKGLKHPIG